MQDFYFSNSKVYDTMSFTIKSLINYLLLSLCVVWVALTKTRSEITYRLCDFPLKRI